MYRILIVDDEKNVLSSFKKILDEQGYAIETCSSALEALGSARKHLFDLLIMDIRMPGMSGLEAFSKFKEIDPKLPIVIMTAYGTTELAIKAMQLGAFDYVIKPFEVPAMKQLIEKALEAARLMKTVVEYEPKEDFGGDRIIGSSFKMREIYKIIGQTAAADVAVLLRGESGTGKELFARAVYNHSKRKDRPFFVINSAAIPETLLESELFGYEKGAFTDARERRIGKLEQCHGGTLFLDEIGDMPLSIQTKLLRALEDKSFERLGSNKTIKVDIRLITATNKNLESLIKEGRFREDLFYRLNVVSIQIPPLRERKEDIPRLVEYFLARSGREFQKKGVVVSGAALEVLQKYDWPGNVRELENTIKKALIFTKSALILPEGIFIPENPLEGQKQDFFYSRELISDLVKNKIRSGNGNLYKEIIEEVERALFMETLKQVNGNQSEAAKILGISRPTLKDKIVRFGLRKAVFIQEG